MKPFETSSGSRTDTRTVDERSKRASRSPAVTRTDGPIDGGRWR